MFLEHQGYPYICATTGSQGIANFESFKPDLVLLDRMLLDGDGAKICQQIRRVSDIPIVMLTGKVGSQDLVDGLETGRMSILVSLSYTPNVSFLIVS